MPGRFGPRNREAKAPLEGWDGRLLRRVSGDTPVGGDEVIVGRVREAADQGTTVEEPGRQRQLLADEHAGEAGGDRREGAADPLRGVGLGVEGLELAGPSPQPDLDHRRVPGRSPRGPGVRPHPQQVGQREAASPGEQAHFQETPPGGATTLVGFVPTLAVPGDHEATPGVAHRARGCGTRRRARACVRGRGSAPPPRPSPSCT